MEDSEHLLWVMQADCPGCGKESAWGSLRTYRKYRAFLCRACAPGLFVMACHAEVNDFFTTDAKSG